MNEGTQRLGVAETLAVALVLAWAVWDRVAALGTLPGINGDEAWYANQLLRWSHAEEVSWRTPTGNLPGPLHLGLLFALLELPLPRAFWVLRLPTVLSSLAAIAVVFVALKQRFGRDTGRVAALLLAALPVGIVYARLGWDPSHAPLLGALGVWAALECRFVVLPFYFAFALWCHPTNLFLAPFLLALVFGSALERMPRPQAFARSALAGVGLLAATPVLLLTAPRAGAAAGNGALVERLFSPSTWGHFLAALGDFFSGAASFSYTAGPPLTTSGTLSGSIVMVLFAALALAAFAAKARATSTEVGAYAGTLLMLLTFAVFAGAAALKPHHERYGLVLVTPMVVAVSLALRRVATFGRPAAIAPAVALALAALAFTEARYFAELEKTGSTSHETFWTGAVEPKAAAFSTIEDNRDRLRTVRVIADSWWTFQPLQFLAFGEPGMTVERLTTLPEPDPRTDVFLVGFPMGALTAAVPPEAARGPVTVWSIPGTARSEALRVVRLSPY